MSRSRRQNSSNQEPSARPAVDIADRTLDNPTVGGSQRLIALCQNLAMFLLTAALTMRIFLPGLTVETGENGIVWLLAGGAFLFMSMEAVLSREERLRNPRLTLAVMTVITVSLCSALWASSPMHALYQSGIWLSDALLFFTICRYARDRRLLSAIMAIMLACLTVEAAYTVYQYFIGLPATRAYVARNDSLLYQLEMAPNALPLLLYKLDIAQAVGHFTLANSLGGYLIMLLPALAMLTWRLWQQRSDDSLGRGKWLLTLAILAVTTWALLLTKSRGSLLALAVGVAIMIAYWLLRLNRPWLLGLSAVGVLASSLVAYWLVVYTAVGSWFGMGLRSFVMRCGYWLAAWRIWQDHPWCGIGIGNFSDYYYTYKPIWAEEVNKAHNCWLQWLSETGLLGIAALGLLVTALWRLRASHWGAVDTNVALGCGVPRDHNRGPSDWLFALAMLLSCTLLALNGRFVEIEPLMLWLTDAKGTTPSWLTAPGVLIFGYYLMVPVMTLAWAACFIYWRRLGAIIAHPAALQCGLLVFLLHSGLDIDWYEPSLSQAFFVLLALLVAQLPEEPKFWPCQGQLRMAGLVMACGVMIWFALLTLPNLLTLAYVKRNMSEWHHDIAGLSNRRDQQAAQQAYHRSLEIAHDIAPWDYELNQAIAISCLETAKTIMSERRYRDYAVQLADLGETRLTQTIAWRSHFASVYCSQAQLCLETAGIWQSLGDRQKQAERLRQAHRAIAAALALYPYKPIFWAVSAKIKETSGTPEQSDPEYHRVLYLDDLSQAWVELPPEIRQKAMKQSVQWLRRK